MIAHAELLAALDNCLAGFEAPGLTPDYRGKVRDVYARGDRLLVVTSDRVSAFDRILGLIPYKGQVLNQLSAWWFNQTADLVANHLVGVPDPNAMVVRRAQMLPVEVVVRGYITGVTDTSIWTLYARGERTPYGVALPDGLQKNDPLPAPIITPTTKAQHGQHDETLSEAALLASGIVAPDVWQAVRTAALAVFARGQALAAEAGLILVDTKYEFGLIDGEIALCDELHTPDSSRYWLASSYDAQRQPHNFSKEFLREWYALRGYTGHGEPPPMPDDIRAMVASRYIAAYERLTAKPFVPGIQPTAARVAALIRSTADD